MNATIKGIRKQIDLWMIKQKIRTRSHALHDFQQFLLRLIDLLGPLSDEFAQRQIPIENGANQGVAIFRTNLLALQQVPEDHRQILQRIALRQAALDGRVFQPGQPLHLVVDQSGDSRQNVRTGHKDERTFAF